MIKSETLITTDGNGLTGQFLAKTDRTNQRIRKRPKTDITGYRREDSYLFPNLRSGVYFFFFLLLWLEREK